MCGIIVSSGGKIELDKLQEGHKITNKRGPDDSSTFSVGDNTFMFNRLSIMGLSFNGMQPFSFNGNVLVANAEIYNFKQIKNELKNKHIFLSESDCEVLLPLYDELGFYMFNYLDAEFAIVLYDKNLDLLIAARDPLGIRPLFYGYIKNTNNIVFSSEVKGIIDAVDKVNPFPPGHYFDGYKFNKFSDVCDVNEYHNETFDDILHNINDKLTKAVIKRLDSDAEVGYLLSGGLDSSLVCSIAQRASNYPIKTFSVGMESDAIDLKYAKQVSEFLGTDHTEVVITKEDVLSNIEEVIYALESYDITTVRASMGMYLISKYIHNNTNIKVLLTGEVSDELFGYKYTDFAPNPEEFQAESVKRINEIYMYDVLRADRCLASNSLEARVRFGDIDFTRYVMRISPLFKMNKYRVGKYLLRKAFEGTYLPRDILYREKAAFSDAVGHSLVEYLKEYAENKYSDQEFKEKIKGYQDTAPFTKESLLYREIFDEYYPNHAHLVKGYWMPNKKWDNCNVDDPSARVLTNYGKSGS